MPKLRLSLDDLQVASFSTAPTSPRRERTVHGHEVVEEEKFIPWEETPGHNQGPLGTTATLTTANQTFYPQVTCASTCVGTCDQTCAVSCWGTCDTCPNGGLCA